jgi:hypothetical protein
MSFDMPDDPHSRDTALARMLAEALESRSLPAGQTKGSACPDAEVLAAYAEHGLADDETARWEIHFADCGRCQQIIAVLAASGEDLTNAEVERLGNLVAASAISREPVVPNKAAWWTAIWRRPAFRRWLVPAIGMAAAAVLLLALRQATPRQAPASQGIAATTAAPQSEIAQGAPAASPTKPGETLSAQANLPAPAVAAPPSGALSLDRDKETAQANSSAAASSESARKQEAFSGAAQPPPVAEADNRLEAREDAANDNRAPSAQAAPAQNAEAKDALTAGAAGAPAVVPLAPPPVPERARAAPPGLGGAIAGSFSRDQVQALAKTAVPPIVFSSPGRTALWRLGSDGRIERSADQGQTWQLQSSGVTSGLLAGAAPSEKIAWVVGLSGIILRTEDGQRWQRVAPPLAAQSAAPPGPPLDWIGVEARDALRATIVSRDLRRFVTTDGGRTWLQQQ